MQLAIDEFCPLCYGAVMNPAIEPTASLERRKPGPVARPNTRVATVILDEDLLDWGKSQPGGLSETMRRLLRTAMEGANAVE